MLATTQDGGGLVGIEPYHFFTRVDFDDIAKVGTFTI